MINAEAERIIRDFPLGIIATLTPEGFPAASPKGTFLMLDETTIAYGDIRSPGTRRNLMENADCEVVFVDPFLRKGVRLRGRAKVLDEDSAEYLALIPWWVQKWGDLATRITSLVVIGVDRALPLATPPYDDGMTEEEMIALYQAKYAEIYPKAEE